MNPIEKFEGELKEIYDDTINKVAIEFYNKGRKEALEAVQELIVEYEMGTNPNYNKVHWKVLKDKISKWQEELK